MAILGVSIWNWIFILWILTFLITELIRIFTNTFPEGVFWGVFLIFCGTMLLIHYLSSFEVYLGASLGQIKISVFVAVLLILYGVRFLLKGRMSAAINVALIGLFGVWVLRGIP